MRIESLGRTPGGAPPSRSTAGRGGFSLGEASDASDTRQAAAIRPAPALDALLALQGVAPEDPREKRRRELRRGRGLLDALDDMKVALLEGLDAPSSLKTLADRLSERRVSTGNPGLDDALSAIELRAQVELAKRGR